MKRVGRILFVVPVLTLMSGCATFVGPIELSPRGEVRRLTQAEFDAPLKSELQVPTADPDCSGTVGANELVGRWMMTNHSIHQLVDRRLMTEERNSNIVHYTYELRPDGSFVRDEKYRGNWMLSGGILTFCYSDRSTVRYSVRRLTDVTCLLSYTPDYVGEWTARQQKSPGIHGFRKRPSGHVDEDGNFRGFVDYPYAHNGEVRFTERILGSAAVFQRMGVAVQTRAVKTVDVERKKNLDSLLKTGVITEDEYQKERRKIEEGGK